MGHPLLKIKFIVELQHDDVQEIDAEVVEHLHHRVVDTGADLLVNTAQVLGNVGALLDFRVPFQNLKQLLRELRVGEHPQPPLELVDKAPVLQ